MIIKHSYLKAPVPYKCSKISKKKSLSLNKLVIMAGIHKMHVRIANGEDTDHTLRSNLLWVCTVCLNLFVLNFRTLKYVNF